jgi:hypothetical protein
LELPDPYVLERRETVLHSAHWSRIEAASYSYRPLWQGALSKVVSTAISEAIILVEPSIVPCPMPDGLSGR